MANKQPEVTAQTRRNLQQAFWSLYSERPITKISIKEITDRAGYNRGTFYLYYRDVYDILDQMEQEILDTIDALIQKRLIKDGILDIQGNMGFIIGLAKSYERGRVIARLLGDDGDPRFKARFKELIWPLVEVYLSPAGSFSSTEERFVKEFYLSGLLAVITAWLEDDANMPIDELIQLIMQKVLRAAQ
ncbi:MAG TPA: TetR/AcrR family transcriptional regulator [Slackia equolifaciens]|uniref:TetR/AcrR family transcriptional regulator n=1 Tax=Slackia equolifaciens TaxID=498718 RepID=A0A9D2UV88_9ACTN|nr:TetR/AcrR family transcriptional regulator [Slackia equolifaciens]